MFWNYSNADYRQKFRNWALNEAKKYTAYYGVLSAGWVALCFGFKWNNNDGVFYMSYANGDGGLCFFGRFIDGDFTFTPYTPS